jgi:hypothetical protein
MNKITIILLVSTLFFAACQNQKKQETDIEDGKICLLTTHNKAGTGYLWKSDDSLHFDDPISGFDKMNQYVSQETIDNTTRPHADLFGRPQILIQDGRLTHLYVASGVNFTGGLGTHSCVMRIQNSKTNR